MLQASRKVAVHFLEAYRLAIVAAMRLQFTGLGHPQGRPGVLSLLRGNAALGELLAAEGCAP